MKQSKRLGIFLIALLWISVSVLCWIRPPQEFSYSERRRLAQFPAFNRQFSTEFEDYANDQFPFRDGFRGLKSRFQRQILQVKDDHGIYFQDGYAAQLQYPLQESSVNHACNKFSQLYLRYLQNAGCRIFLAIVTDKHYFLADSGGYPSLDYDRLVQLVRAETPWASYVDLFPSLSVSDYYHSDTHWRQEQLTDTADVLCRALQIPLASQQNYTLQQWPQPFYGVYRGQAALDLPAETICTLHTALLDRCQVYHYDSGQFTQIYDAQKVSSRDLYDIYLSGAAPLLRIEDPKSDTQRELIVFRDSFGSSLIPLLMQGYRAVTLVDTRYIDPGLLGQFLRFEGKDVLFLYSTILLNQSSALK